MGRKKIKVKLNVIMSITITPEIYEKLKKHSIKYDNGIISVTVRQAIFNYLESFNY
jgi:sulfite reductase beta subunit-like hemoprotein